MANKYRLPGGKYAPSIYGTKKTRSITLTDTPWKGLQLLADHHGDRSRAEYLERLVREECERLGIAIESAEQDKAA